KQILITMGGMIVGEELIKVIWGPQQIPLPLPTTLRGAFILGDAAIEKYRLLAVLIGLVVFIALLYALNRTKVGLLIRAGVQDREMVESLGYRIKRLFVGVFVTGSALILLVLELAVCPFLFPGSKPLGVAAKMLVFILLVASYDLLLGYTGIVSFAHTMFFGIGAYGVAIASTRLGEGLGAVMLGTAIALVVSLVLSLVIGLFSLRVKAIFFAMITLAVAAGFQTLASQLSELTGGEDGLTFRNPAWLAPSFEPFENPVLGVTIDGKIVCYYLLLVVVAVGFLALLRIVNSPFGRVLQAIRENDFRAEAIGYRTVVYRTLSNVLSALFAT